MKLNAAVQWAVSVKSKRLHQATSQSHELERFRVLAYPVSLDGEQEECLASVAQPPRLFITGLIGLTWHVATDGADTAATRASLSVLLNVQHRI